MTQEAQKQEPVAWFRYQQGSRVYYDSKKWDDCQPLYTQSASDYERGFIDGMQKQMQSSVDKAVNVMSQRTWQGLTDEEIQDAGRFSYCRGGTSEKLYHIMWNSQPSACIGWSREELIAFTKAVEAKYQEKNQ